jgi:acyl-coenzyme A synthetase/AMP-(fatty) acid ligase
MKLTDFTSYADAQANFAGARLWELFDGDRERLNIAHECIDRHVDGDRPTVIVVRAAGGWIATKDLGRTDEDGYFFHGGRADDVIISAGWTMSAIEIEDAVLKHPDVREVGAIGVPDKLRGQVVKAFVATDRKGDDHFTKEIQDLVRARLSQHEYPRVIEFVTELPKTPAGKVNRKILRTRERTNVG